MAAHVAKKAGLESNPHNFMLMHAMVAGDMVPTGSEQPKAAFQFTFVVI